MIREQLASLDSVNLILSGNTGLIMSLVLAIIMFGIALGIKLETLKNVFTSPKSIITGIVLQWVGLPAITFLLIMLLHNVLTPMVCLGMILVACCPGGNISNFMSSYAKGNVELSVSMTAVTTVFAPAVTPFNFWLWGNLFLKYATLSEALTIPHLEIPFSEIFKTVFLILGIPILLGMLCSHFLPRFSDRIKKPMSVFSMVVFVVMVLGMFIPNRKLFIDYIIFIFILVLIHNACAFMTGYFGATAMRLPAIDRKSITIEVGIQNSGLGLTLLLNPAIFNPAIWNNPESGVLYGGMLFVTCWWGIWHIISGLTLASIFRRSKAS
ncbi:MAG: bile acid:sodium symporter family protein [Bacteroidales bacterium]|nr:bile acid:sodium symporter family protein [Bacteroidales bacterium]